MTEWTKTINGFLGLSVPAICDHCLHSLAAHGGFDGPPCKVCQCRWFVVYSPAGDRSAATERAAKEEAAVNAGPKVTA